MKAILFTLLFSIFLLPVFGQNGVRIAATTGTADASAMLDVVSSTKGFLVPRLSLTGPALTNPSPVTSPADGLLIYNLGLSGIAAKGLYYWDATTAAWRQLSSGTLSGGGTTNYVAKWTSPSAIGNSQIFDNATNIGINSATPAQKLDVQGGTARISGLATASGNRPVYSNTSGDLLTNTNIGLTDAIYIRGTGLNNNANQVVKIGTATPLNGGSRGLTLVIITKSTHAVASTTAYDTYGSTVASDALATALNAMTNAQIGILTSFDAWEGQITTNLQNAFKRLGLYKALGTTIGGSRRPYAAIFEGATGSAIPTATAAEVEHSADATTDYAEIRGWLIDGSFVATTQVPSGLSTPIGTYAAGVDESGNVKVSSLAGSGLRPVFATSNGTLSTGLTPATIYSYTGADQTYTVPAGVTSLTIKLWGAGGGGGYVGGWGAGFSGGAGGFTQGVLTVTPGQVLTVIVGAGGLGGNTANNSANYGGGARSCNGGSDCRYGGQGGGRSAIRNSGGTELMTAGGGGGGGSSRNGSLANYGGAGGGIEGQAGTSDQYNYAHGMGGNQSAGGAGACCQTNNGFAGSQFAGGQNAAQAYGGSGGGGWYGGGGGGYQESNTMGGGGGGSGYIGGTGVSNAYTIKGDLSEPPKVDDIHYLQGIARGGLTVGSGIPLQGGAGRVVIIPNP